MRSDEQSGRPAAEPGFEPIRPNPYIVGNPVRGRAMFFGRDAEFALVRERFTSTERGGLLVFCGERRSGKTSILFQIVDKRLGEDFVPVLIDMQSMAIASEQDFLSKVAESVLESVGPSAARIAAPSFPAGSNQAARFQRFISEVLAACPGSKLLLLFDEYELFENKIEAGVLDPDVLLVLASLMEHQPVYLVFTGSQHLEARRQPYWKILGKSIYKRVSYLDREDALNLVRRPVEGRVQYDEAALECIYRLTAGQPFYTQAICQSLVDLLNDNRSNHATLDLVMSVVQNIVENPLPQMIFLWDTLARDEKLVLALLAEALADESDLAGETRLTDLIRQRAYPLALDPAVISTTLEKLFKEELLSKGEHAASPGYGFRMDLWRLWIRRMHSVWQVMREEGMDIRPVRPPTRRWFVPLLVGASAVGLGLIGMTMLRNRPGPSTPGGASSAAPARGVFVLQAEPAQAQIDMDNRRVGIGTFQDSLVAERSHSFRVSAAGYADTSFQVQLPANATREARVALRPLMGALRIETVPLGAEVRVDGTSRGRSPVTVTGLSAATAHRIEAVLPGHDPVRAEATPRADSTLTVSLSMLVAKAGIVITSDPPGAEVLVDATPRGRTPANVADLPQGTHTITARAAGYVPADTTLLVDARTGQVHLVLKTEPPAVLVIQGDHPAEMYIDGVLVKENVQNSGPQELRSGLHQVRVRLVSGEVIEETIELRARERVVFDFSTRQVKRSAVP